MLWSSLWLGLATDAVNRARAFVRDAARRKPGTMPPGAVRLAEVVGVLQTMRAGVAGATNAFDAIFDDRDALSSMGFVLRMNGLKVQSATLPCRSSRKRCRSAVSPATRRTRSTASSATCATRTAQASRSTTTACSARARPCCSSIGRTRDRYHERRSGHVVPRHTRQASAAHPHGRARRLRIWLRVRSCAAASRCADHAR